MSYCVIHVQKFTKGGLKGIEIHNRREKEGVSHTNPDIDWERTKENYSLKDNADRTYQSLISERIKQLDLPKAVRKDAVLMCSFIITSDKSYFDALPAAEQRRFFADSLKFIEERYGAQNVIAATVHMDETTPHMHVCTVPVTPDGRLSAKDVFNRSSLRELQDKFYEKVGKDFGLERGERGSKAQHLDIAVLKARTIEQRAAERAQELSELEYRVETLENSKNALQAKSAALEAKITRSLSVIENIKHLPSGKKTILGKVELTQNEFEALFQTARAYYKAHSRAEEMTLIANKLHDSTAYQHVQQLEQKISEQQQQIRDLKHEIQKEQGISKKYLKELDQLDRFFEKYEQAALEFEEFKVSEKILENSHSLGR